ncbi:MAG: hypothetical protein CL624_13885 [Arcobacter sp.]|nr:hypothetical protein [Arcobacter sp.]
MVSIVKYGQEIDLSKIVAINGKKSLTLDNLVLNNTIKIKIPAGIKYLSELVEDDLKITFKDEEGNILELILKDMSTLLAQNDGFTLVELTQILADGKENVVAITDLASASQASAAGPGQANANSDSGSTPDTLEDLLSAQNDTNNAGINNARLPRDTEDATLEGDETPTENNTPETVGTTLIDPENIAPVAMPDPGDITSGEVTIVDNKTIVTNEIVVLEEVEVIDSEESQVITSVDHWGFTHNGGSLIIDVLTEYSEDLNNYNELNGNTTANMLDSYIYLAKVESDGSLTIIDENDDSSLSNSDDGSVDSYDSFLSLSTLDAGNYVLAIGSYNLSSEEALSLFNESYSYTYTSSTEGSGPYQITFTGDIEITDLPKSGQLITIENNDLTIDVLANDTDVDSDPSLFSLDNVSVIGGKGSASIVNNKLVFSPENDFDYLASGEILEVQVDYTMSDDKGASSSSYAIINVLGTNDAPIIDVQLTATVNEDESININYIASDIDGTIDYTNINANNGDVNIIGNQITYTPYPEFSGTDTISIFVVDNNGESTTKEINVTVNPVNDDAVITGDISADLIETDAILTASGILTSTDVDNDDNKFTAETVTGTYGSVTIDENGNWDFIASSTFDELAIVNGVAQTLSEDFTVKSIDGTESTITINIEATNDAPTVSSEVITLAINESELDPADITLLESVSVDINATDFSFVITNSTIVSLFDSLNIESQIKSAISTALNNIPQEDIDLSITKVDGKITVDASIPDYSGPTPLNTIITQENLNIVLLDHLGSAFNLPFENAVFEGEVEVADVDSEDFTLSLGDVSLEVTSSNKYLTTLFEELSGANPELSLTYIQELASDLFTGATSSSLSEAKVIEVPATAVKLLQTAGLLSISLEDSGEYKVISPLFNTMKETDSIEISFDYTANDGIVDSNKGTTTFTILGSNDAPTLLDETVTVETEIDGNSYSGTLQGAYNLNMFKTVFDNIDTSNGPTGIIDQVELQQALLDNLGEDVNIDVSDEKINEIKADLLPSAFAALGLTTDDILPALSSLTDPIDDEINSLQTTLDNFPTTIKDVIEDRLGELTDGSTEDLQLDSLINNFVSLLFSGDISGATAASETLGLSLFDIYNSSINYTDITAIQSSVTSLQSALETSIANLVPSVVGVIETQIADTSHTSELETLVQSFIDGTVDQTTFVNSLFTVFDSAVTPTDLLAISTQIPTIISGISTHANVETLRTDLISDIESAISSELSAYPILNPTVDLTDIVTQFVTETEAENTDADTNLINGLISIYGPIVLTETTDIQNAITPLFTVYTADIQTELVSQIVTSIETQIGDTSHTLQLTTDVIQLLSDIEANPANQTTILGNFADDLFTTFDASVTPADLLIIQGNITTVQTDLQTEIDSLVPNIVNAIETQIGVEDTAALTVLVGSLISNIETTPANQTAFLEVFIGDLFTLYNTTVDLEDLEFIQTSLTDELNDLLALQGTFPADLAEALIVDSLDLTLDTTNWTGDVSQVQYNQILTWVNDLLSDAQNNPSTFDSTKESKTLLINTTDLLGLDLNDVIVENLPSEITDALDALETSLSLDPDAIIANLDINQLLIDLGIDIDNIDYNQILNDARVKITDFVSTLSPSDLANNPDAISETFKGILDTIFNEDDGILTQTIDTLIDVTDEELKDAIVSSVSDAIILEISTEMNALITALKNNFGKESETITMNIETITNQVVSVNPDNGGLSTDLTEGTFTLDVASYALGDEITVNVTGEDANGEAVSYDFDFIVVDDGGTLKLSDTPNYDKLADSVIETVVEELTQDINLSVDEIKSVVVENIFTQLGLDTGFLDDDARDIIADKMVQDLYDRLGMDEDIQDLATLKYELSGDPVVVIKDVDGNVQSVSSVTEVEIDPIYGTYTISNPEFENLDTTWKAEVSFEYTVTDGDLLSNTQTVNVTLNFADGTASDGHIAGAKVFEDINGDQIDNDDGAFTYTDANGDFNTNAFSGEYGLATEGGTDISTGFAFESVLTAPAGSSILSPMTTLIDNLMKMSLGSDNELDKEEAEALVSKALGISSDIDLFTYDSYGIGKDEESTDEEKAQAVAVQKVATQLMTIVSLGGASLAHENNTTEESESSNMFSAIAEKIIDANDANEVVVLNDADDISEILTKSGVDAGSENIKDSIVNTNTLMQDSNDVEELADIQEVIEESEEEITLNGDIVEVLTLESLEQKIEDLKPNTAPTIELIDTQVTNEDENILIDFNASDIDTNNILTPSVSATNGTAEIVNGKISFTPAKDFVGTAVVTLEVSDGRDTTSQSFEVTVSPINDAAIVSSDSKNLTETNEVLTTSGILTSTDIDNENNSFTAEEIIGENGTVNIESNGVWSFTANSTFDNLNVGDTLSEDFTVTTIDGTQTTITINIQGTNDTAIVSSASEILSETNSVLTTSGTLTSTDIDNEDNTFTAETVIGTNGSVTIDENGAWNFTASSTFDNLNVGENVNEDFIVTTIDGTESTISIQINGTNDAAIVSSASEILSETNEVLSASGTLTSTDIDNEDNSFTVETVIGTNGSVSIDENGNWNFTSSSNFDELNVGDTLNEDFIVTTIDGTESTISIQINGTNDLPTVEVVSPDAILEDSTTATNISFTTNDIDSEAIITSASALNGNAQADIENGVISYTPDENFTGTDTITLILDDGNGQTVSKEISITVDPLPVLTIEAQTVNESESATFTANLSKASDVDTVFEVSVSNAEGDVNATPQIVTIMAGQTSADFIIDTIDDDISEPNEIFNVFADLFSGNVKNGMAETTLTVVDNDQLSIYTNDVEVNEEDGMAIITISLSTISEQEVSVDFEMNDITATRDDYENHNGTIIFQAGETSKEIQVALNNDTIYDTNESFELVLSNPINAIISADTAIVNIKDADITASISLDENVTADNILNNQESTQEVTISGTVTQYAQEGDSVTLTVNGKEYTTEVTAAMTFAVAVAGNDLLADSDKTIEAQVVAQDDTTSFIASDSLSYEVDVSSTGPATVEILEDENNDGFINYGESNGKVDVIVNTPADAKIGEILTVTNPDGTTSDYEITEDIIVNGLLLEFDAQENETVTVSAVITDEVGNISQSGNDSAVVDTVALGQGELTISNTNGVVQLSIALPINTQIGDVITLINPNGTTTNYPVTQDMIDNDYKFVTTYDSLNHGAGYSISAYLTDEAGNGTDLVSEYIFVNNAPTAQALDVSAQSNPDYYVGYSGYLPGAYTSELINFYPNIHTGYLGNSLNYSVDLETVTTSDIQSVSQDVETLLLQELGLISYDETGITYGSNTLIYLNDTLSTLQVELDALQTNGTSYFEIPAAAATIILDSLDLEITHEELVAYISEEFSNLISTEISTFAKIDAIVNYFNLDIADVITDNIPESLSTTLDIYNAQLLSALSNISNDDILEGIDIYNIVYNQVFNDISIDTSITNELKEDMATFIYSLDAQTLADQQALSSTIETYLSELASGIETISGSLYDEVSGAIPAITIQINTAIVNNIEEYIQTQSDIYASNLNTQISAAYPGLIVPINEESLSLGVETIIIDADILNPEVSLDLNITKDDFIETTLQNQGQLGDLSNETTIQETTQKLLADLNIRAGLDFDVEDIATLQYYIDGEATVEAKNEAGDIITITDANIDLYQNGQFNFNSEQARELDPSYDVEVSFNYYVQDTFGARSESAPVTLTIDLIDNSLYINSELSDTTVDGERTLVLDTNINESHYVQALNIFVDGATADSTLEFAGRTIEAQAATQPDNVVITYDEIVYTTGVEDNTFVAPTLTSTQTLFDFGFEDEGKYIEELTFNNGVINQNFYEEDEIFSEDINLTDSDNNGNLEASGPWGKDELIFGDAKQVTNINGIDVSLLGLYQVDVTFKTIEIPTIDNVDEWWSENWIDTSSLQDLVSKLVDSNDYTAVYTDRENGYKLNIDGTIYDDNTENIVDGSWRIETIDSQTYLIIEIDDVLTVAYKEENGEIFKTEIGIPGVTEDMGTWYYGENLNVTSIQALLTQIENNDSFKIPEYLDDAPTDYYFAIENNEIDSNDVYQALENDITITNLEDEVNVITKVVSYYEDRNDFTTAVGDNTEVLTDGNDTIVLNDDAPTKYIDAKEGEDTLDLSGQDSNLDLGSLLANVSLYNIENIDMTDDSDTAHILSNFTLDEFISLTDEDNTLKIFGDDADKIELDLEQNWTQSTIDGIPVTEDGFNVYYSYNENQELKLLIEDTITVENV